MPLAEASLRKPRGQGHERRNEILAAAKAIFTTEGYEAFTTRKLAAAAGLSQTGLYVYFKNREEIFDALCRQSFAELATELRSLEADPAEGFSGLEALIHAYIDFAIAHPEEYRISFMDGPGVVWSGKTLKDLSLPLDEFSYAMQTFLMVRGCLFRLTEQGLVRPIDLTVATQTVMFALHGLASIFIARRSFLKANEGDLINGMFEMIKRGLAA